MPFLPFTSVKRTPKPIQARDREHLLELIGEEIERSGHECSLNHIDVSEVTSMCSVFEEHPTFNGNISNWDTSNVMNMSRMFRNSSFNGDLSKWNTGQVMDMTAMFQMASFNGDISQWDTANAECMHSMFRQADFQGDISRWNVGKVRDMSSMFSYNDVFQGDLSRWDTGRVESMETMFFNSRFNGNISMWNTRSVHSMTGMFEGASFNGDISQWNVSEVCFMNQMFKESIFQGDISCWDVGNVIDMRGMFVFSEFCGDLSTWKIHPECRVTNAFHIDQLERHREQPLLLYSPLAIACYLAKDQASSLDVEFESWKNVVQGFDLEPLEAAYYISDQLLGRGMNPEPEGFQDFSNA